MGYRSRGALGAPGWLVAAVFAHAFAALTFEKQTYTFPTAESHYAEQIVSVGLLDASAAPKATVTAVDAAEEESVLWRQSGIHAQYARLKCSKETKMGFSRCQTTRT